MDQARLNWSRWWRGMLLAVLCALVYYVSYDHGRESLKFRLKEQESRFQEEQDRLLLEIRRVRDQLSDCLAAQGGAEPAGAIRVALRTNQSQTLFDNQLTLSVLDLDSEAGQVRVQLNFLLENRLVIGELAVGGSLRFSLGGRDWAVVVNGLTLTTANLNLMEIKSDP